MSTGVTIQYAGRPMLAIRKASMPAGGCMARAINMTRVASPTATALAISPDPIAHNARSPATEERR